MALGFTAPDLLFIGPWDAAERSMAKPLFRRLREAGYERLVEPCCGTFALPLVARDAGWQPEQMWTSDVSLYSSVIGYLLMGRDPRELGVRIDGDAIALELPDVPVAAAAEILYRQLVLRMEARAEVDYWLELRHDLAERADEHRATIRGYLDGMVRRLEGLHYEPEDLLRTLASAIEDPKAVIVLTPPSLKGGYERFFNTNDRLTWDAEPGYNLFDPVEGARFIADAAADQPALVIYQEQRKPGESTRPPHYARHLTRGQYIYHWSNRREELLALQGGMKVKTRSYGDVGPLEESVLPADYSFRNGATVLSVRPISAGEAAYYKELWMHRIDVADAGSNLAVFVDGYLAGIGGYSWNTIQRPYPGMDWQKWRDAVLLRYALGAPHERFRLTRLVTAIMLHRQTLFAVATPATTIHAGAVARVMTSSYTRHPESKQLRGLMKLVERVPQKPDGWKLMYAAPIREEPVADTYAAWLTKEQAYLERKGAPA